MSEPFLSEIRIMSFAYAPQGWAKCNGQFLPINQNQGLFSLLGTRYGGNGQTTFQLPNLQGKVPIHWGDSHDLGETGGQEFHTLAIGELPTHTHVLQGTNVDGTQPIPINAYIGRSATQFNAPPSSLAAMDAGAVTSVGGSQPHENRQPYIVLNFCIALQGLFPTPN